MPRVRYTIDMEYRETTIKVNAEQVDLMDFPVRKLVQTARAFDRLGMFNRDYPPTSLWSGAMVPKAFLNTFRCKGISKCECGNWYHKDSGTLLDISFRPVILDIELDDE